jgi:hypothetical protein
VRGGRSFFWPLSWPSLSACSTSSVRSRTCRHGSASASWGRSPAYAKTEHQDGVAVAAIGQQDAAQALDIGWC